METTTASKDLALFSANRRFSTVLADSPWRFQNSTGKVAPEHRRLSRYVTLSLDEIKALPVAIITAQTSHLYLLGPERPRGRRRGRRGGMALHLQVEHRLA
jgi:hypothetical protein